MYYSLVKTPHKKHKYEVYIYGPKSKIVKFGDNRYEDYLMHKDPARKRLYILRHRKNEDWTASGLYTPGFWSLHLLWSKPTIEEAVANLRKKFGLELIQPI